MLCHSPERLQGFASWSTAASQPQPCSPGLFPASLGVTQDTSGVRQGPGRAGPRLCGAPWVSLRPWVCSTSSPMPPRPAQESPHSPGANGDAAGGGPLSLGLPAVTAGTRSCPQQEHRAACVGTHRPQPRREGRPGGGTGKKPRSWREGTACQGCSAFSPGNQLSRRARSGEVAVSPGQEGTGRTRQALLQQLPAQAASSSSVGQRGMDPGAGKQTALFSAC